MITEDSVSPPPGTEKTTGDFALPRHPPDATDIASIFDTDIRIFTLVSRTGKKARRPTHTAKALHAGADVRSTSGRTGHRLATLVGDGH